ncbi:Putative 2-acylglycerophosphoethanolamine acyltransferase [gamma proteobacterium IMCC1989]|nr:Putative 2-acylglycerophosphoethanolamine acyltransferase [gamma proteobacterium IMCC1989]
MKTLFKTPFAIPFLVAVFLNAFVDLGHKIIIQNTLFKIHDGGELVIFTAIINALILLPFILLFLPAGMVSDRVPKHRVMRFSAWAAVALTVFITISYVMGWFWFAFGMTFLLAAQSAFYSPAKLAYLKGFFGKQHLAQANGLVQAIAIIAILSGTFVFSILFEMWFPEMVNGSPASKGEVLQAMVPAGFLLVLNSVIELVMVYRLPNVDGIEKTDAKLAVQVAAKIDSSANELTNTATAEESSSLLFVLRNSSIRLSIIGLAMFWSVGQVMLAAFPAFAKDSLGELNTIVIQGVLAATGVGIAIGSLIAGRCSKNYIETGIIPIGAIGLAIGLFILPQLDSALTLAFDFLWIGVMGGLFIIPLNALIQYHAKDKDLGKTLAANNLIQNIAMLSFLALTVAFSLADIASQQLLQLIAVIALVGGLYTVITLPQSLIRFGLGFVMSRHYKTDVQGMQNIPQKGGVLLLGNHISFVDWAIIQIACPRPVHFVMEKSIYDRWYLQWFLKLVGCIPIQAGAQSKAALADIAALLDAGKVVCLFPEGTLSRTGNMATFRKGYERAVELSHDESICIVPFYLHGLWGSQFSRSSTRIKSTRTTGYTRDVMIAFGEAMPKDTSTDVLKRRVFDLSIHAWDAHIHSQSNIAATWIDRVKSQGDSNPAITDTLMGSQLSASKALAAASAIAKRISSCASEQNIGVLLPAGAGGVLTNMATLLAGKTIVNLNYTASTDAIAAAIAQAEISTIYTSARFIKKLKDKGIPLEPVLENVQLVYVEELIQSISRAEMLARWLLVKAMPAALLKPVLLTAIPSDATAAILFSSGSEGLPKGVQLSHQNIIANVKQVADVLNTQDNDVVMASLPLFHAFGLTVTQFMPLLEGLPMVCHADPTDVLGVAKAITKNRVTLLCGTSTFLRLYCRNHKVHPLMLDSLRIVVSGAEKLSPDVREAFAKKFNKTIYEGYGATETAPVASVNLPDVIDLRSYRVQQGQKLGSVGMPLPGTSIKIVDPACLDSNRSNETINELSTGEQGMILIGGVQVMQGYLQQPEKTAEVIKVIDGLRWYVSGDKGFLDEEGYLTIVDRYSRFAKIGGEMVSLSAVEETVRKVLALNTVSENQEILAVNLPDEKKGERIVLLMSSSSETSGEPMSMSDVRQAMVDNQCNPLMIPSELIILEALPKLGTGKMDTATAKKIASENT